MNYRLFWKIFSKNKYISIAVVVVFVAMLYNPVKCTYNCIAFYPNRAINEVNSSFLSVCLLWFSLMLFVTAFLIREIKKTAEEVLWVSAESAVYKDTFIFSTVLVFSVSSLIVVYQAALYFFFGKSYTEYLIKVLVDVFFYYFIVGILATIISLTVSFVVNETVSVVVIFVIILLVSSIPDILAELILNNKRNLSVYYSISKLFKIMPQGMKYEINASTGQHLSVFTVGLMLMWLSVFTLLLLYLLKSKRKICYVLLVIVLMSGVYIATRPYLERFESILPEHGIYGFAYSYFVNKHDKSDIPKVSNDEALYKAGFSVTEYEMDIKIQWEMHNMVKIMIDKNDLDSYNFTLSHSYKILSVTDGSGKKLDFTRSGDNFSVSGTGNLTCIVVKYKGNAAPCLSDFESVRLYAGFPWYPYPGKQSVIDVKDFEDIGYDAENHDIKYSPCVNYVSEYDVSIESDYDIYSNLSGNSEGSRGKTDLLTLHGGMIKEDIEGNIHYIYPIELEYDYLLDDGADTWKQHANEEMEKAGLFVKTAEDYYIIFGDETVFYPIGCPYVSGSNVFMFNRR